MNWVTATRHVFQPTLDTWLRRILGTEEFVIINHTDCDLLTFRDQDLVQKLELVTGVAAVPPALFHTFENLAANVRRQIHRVRSHHWIPEHISVRSFIYDVKTGGLAEVAP
ncbi:MAG: hypothetical protein H7Y22_13645 [Gemmatimonadaceae bacterium]|nr:hypothetical protein [Gloeobacterales cyanobacterium ES-bin-141]